MYTGNGKENIDSFLGSRVQCFQRAVVYVQRASFRVHECAEPCKAACRYYF